MGNKVVVLDYGFGNIRSAQRALQRAGADAEVTADFEAAMNADGLVVPGVGAFAACMTGLRKVCGDMIIGRRLAGGRPVLGICVGMSRLFAGISDGTRFYFVHSYAATQLPIPESPLMKAPLITRATHGEPFIAAVENGPLSATQFHPEKSGDAGATLLANWLGSVG